LAPALTVLDNVVRIRIYQQPVTWHIRLCINNNNIANKCILVTISDSISTVFFKRVQHFYWLCGSFCYQDLFTSVCYSLGWILQNKISLYAIGLNAVCSCDDRPILVNVVRCGVPISMGQLGHMMWGRVGLSQFMSYSIWHFPQNVQLLHAL